MTPDALFGSIVRRINQRYLSFGGAPPDVRLPLPVAGRQYLFYLHVPFCVVLCPFCSFHRVEFKRDRTEAYFDALRREIHLATDLGFSFSELYVGGGTPTVMPGELIDTVKLVRALHPVSRVSIETNPDDLDAPRLPELQEVGVNRVSVGVQSFDDDLLREMQRLEKYGSGEQIIQRLKNVSGQFDTLNVDMIFNIPHQTEKSLAADLGILTDDVAAEQVSFYPMMTTRTTERSMRRDLGSVDYSREKRLYEQIVEHMTAAGYSRSSAWCFSRSAGMIDEYIVEQDEYLGLGSGSFSYINGCIYSSTFSINNYLRLIDDGKTGIVRQRQTSRQDQLRYYLMMRLFGGSLEIAEAEQKFSGMFRRELRIELAGLRMLGAISETAGHLTLTRKGYYLWVVMMREFFTAVNNLRDEMRHNISRENLLMS